MRRLPLLLLAAAGCGAAESSSDDEKALYTVARRTFKIVLDERGTLKTKDSTRLFSETWGKIEWLIDEGSVVKKGDVLAKLDKVEAQQRFEQLQSQITQVKTELKSAETNEAIQIDQNKTDIEKAERALERARIELEKMEKADLPKELRDLELQIEEAGIDVERKKDQLEANRQLRKEDFVTENEVKDAEINYKKALNALDTAKMNLDNFLKYKRPMDVKEKRAAVVEAERGLERARKRADAELDSKSAHVQQKRVQLNQLEIQLKRQEEQLGKMEITAPTDGTVIYGDQDRPWDNDRIQVGQQVWQGMVLITLPDPTEMAVVLQIHEADIAKIRKEMPAHVTSETQKDRTFSGTVTKIDAVANAGRRGWRGGDEVKRFKVEIALDGKNHALKTGTSARVELEIGEVADAVAVPLQAVHAKEGKFYCYLATGERVEVEPGRASEDLVEIKSGLKEGDRVRLDDPDATDPGKKRRDDEGMA